jgi:hypothetical protein
MNEEKRQKANIRLKNSRTYAQMERLQMLMDQYYLDGVMGLLPYGIGDVIAALFSMIYIYFAATKVKSIPLTLAIINNSLRDILLGMIPFYIGDVIDFFHRANKQNMILIRGFVDDDKDTVKEVNRKATQSAIWIFIFILAIAVMAYALVEFTLWIATLI